MEIHLAMHMYMCVRWGGVRGLGWGSFPRWIAWALLSSCGLQIDPDRTSHLNHTLSSQPPDHFAGLQGVPEGKETWKFSPKCLSSQSCTHVCINMSATSNQNPHSNLSTQDTPKNRHHPKTNTSLGKSKSDLSQNDEAGLFQPFQTEDLGGTSRGASREEYKVHPLVTGDPPNRFRSPLAQEVWCFYIAVCLGGLLALTHSPDIWSYYIKL